MLTGSQSDLDITANRLFGPQPETSTYLCIWEIHVGAVRSVLSAADGRILAAAGGAFGLNFSDPLNSPAAEFALPLDPDSKSSYCRGLTISQLFVSDLRKGLHRSNPLRLAG